MFTHTVVSEYLVTPETRQLNLSPLVKLEKVRRAGEKQRSECGKKKKKKDFASRTKRVNQAATKSEL